MGMLATELRRMWSRRLVKLLGASVVLALLAGATIGFFNSSRDTASALQETRAQRRRAIQECESGGFQFPRQNRRGFDLEKACRRAVGTHQAPDPGLDYRQMQEVLLAISPPLAILCLLLGASFVGAEWQKETITTTLTWEPRRARLLAAKFAAVALAGFAFSVVMGLVLAASLWPVAALRGSTSDLDAAWLRSASGIGLRMALLGGLTAVVGCAIATVARNTTAALGVAFLYFAVLEGVIRGFRPGWQPWLLGDNAAQFVSGEPVGPAMASQTTLDVTVVLVVYAAVLMAIAMIFFKRRDVT